MIRKLKKDSAAYTHQCSGEGREKREGKSLCGGNHITSLLYLREERKKVLTHSCKGILHVHRYAIYQGVLTPLWPSPQSYPCFGSFKRSRSSVVAHRHKQAVIWHACCMLLFQLFPPPPHKNGLRLLLCFFQTGVQGSVSGQGWKRNPPFKAGRLKQRTVGTPGSLYI